MDVQNEQTLGRLTRIRRALLALRQTAGGTVTRDAINTLEDEISGLQDELLRFQASVAPPSLSTSNFLMDRLNIQLGHVQGKVLELEQEVKRLSAMHPKHAHPEHG
jgi:hypothetical protein